MVQTSSLSLIVLLWKPCVDCTSNQKEDYAGPETDTEHLKKLPPRQFYRRIEVCYDHLQNAQDGDKHASLAEEIRQSFEYRLRRQKAAEQFFASFEFALHAVEEHALM